MAGSSGRMIALVRCLEKGKMREDMRYLGGGMEERWNELAVAIIEQAIADFRRGGPQVKAEVTSFFLSGWFKTLSGGADGRKVLERLWREDAS